MGVLQGVEDTSQSCHILAGITYPTLQSLHLSIGMYRSKEADYSKLQRYLLKPSFFG